MTKSEFPDTHVGSAPNVVEETRLAKENDRDHGISHVTPYNRGMSVGAGGVPRLPQIE